MDKEKVNVIWLKRDLRLEDHKAFETATKSNYRSIIIFVFEPIIQNNYDFSIRHWQFAYHSLKELSRTVFLNLFHDNVFSVFENLTQEYDIKNVYSYQESGNFISFARDREIAKYFAQKEIKWHEFQSGGVIRALKTRKTWDAVWANYVNSEIPSYQIDPTRFINLEHRLDDDFVAKLERRSWNAGVKNAELLLSRFIAEKVENYFNSLSYPDKSRYHCSRLSAHISWGNLSIRQIYNTCKKNRENVSNKRSLDQFMARLKWHCHFIQKFESECRIEFEELNPLYKHIRQKKNKKYIKAWKNGVTGYPLVDAAMRCVEETGYLNFRLRSTVASFLTHHLWQPWQVGAAHLAKKFIDYEPGIHFSQFQMQAGTTGINTIRIYNPVKQALEKDKEAIFIKKWLPELRELPTNLALEPWKINPMEELMYDFHYGNSYPEKIVDHEVCAKFARDELWRLKKSEENKLHAIPILNKHTRRSKRKFTKRR